MEQYIFLGAEGCPAAVGMTPSRLGRFYAGSPIYEASVPGVEVNQSSI